MVWAHSKKIERVWSLDEIWTFDVDIAECRWKSTLTMGQNSNFYDKTNTNSLYLGVVQNRGKRGDLPTHELWRGYPTPNWVPWPVTEWCRHKSGVKLIESTQDWEGEFVPPEEIAGRQRTSVSVALQYQIWTGFWMRINKTSGRMQWNSSKISILVGFLLLFAPKWKRIWFHSQRGGPDNRRREAIKGRDRELTAVQLTDFFLVETCGEIWGVSLEAARGWDRLNSIERSGGWHHGPLAYQLISWFSWKTKKWWARYATQQLFEHQESVRRRVSLGVVIRATSDRFFGYPSPLPLTLGKVPYWYRQTMHQRCLSDLLGALLESRNRRVSLFCGGQALIYLEDKSFRTEKWEMWIGYHKSILIIRNKNICVTLGGRGDSC